VTLRFAIILFAVIVTHLLAASVSQPMEFAQKRLKEGKIQLKDIPYMQRPGGMPDDSDLKPKGFKFPWQK